jgi:hypothetical protein
MRAVVCIALFVAGVVTGMMMERGVAAAADVPTSDADVIAVIPAVDFAFDDGEDVRIVRTQIEGHDVWVAMGYQKFGITHDPDCRLCRERNTAASGD